MQQSLSSGHARLSNAIFDAVGGAAAQTLSQQGMIASVNALGDGAFSTIGAEQSIFQAALDAAAAESKNPKPDKEDKKVDLELLSSKAEDKLALTITKMNKKAQEVAQAKTAADAVIASRNEGEKAVPGLQKYVDIMNDRYPILDLVLKARNKETETSNVDDVDANVVKQLSTFIEAISPGGKIEKKEVEAKELLHESLTGDALCRSIFTMHGMVNEEFTRRQ